MGWFSFGAGYFGELPGDFAPSEGLPHICETAIRRDGYDQGIRKDADPEHAIRNDNPAHGIEPC